MSSRKVLSLLYYTGKTFALSTLSINLKTRKVTKATRCHKTTFIIFRITILSVFVMLLMRRFIKKYNGCEIYNLLAIELFEEMSLVFATIILYINQTLYDGQPAVVLKNLFKIHQNVVQKIGYTNVFNTKFRAIVIFRIGTTFVGILLEATNATKTISDGLLEFVLGIFINGGVIVLTDICFVGFLVFRVFLEQMEAHLRSLAGQLKVLDEHNFSRHMQMKVLCEGSDELDECGLILQDIHHAARTFIATSQVIVFYCVYYNCIFLLIHINQSFYDYRADGQIPWSHYGASLPKAVNLFLFILCVDAVLEKSRRIQLIEFEVICSGRDSRWDESVETFINRQNVEQLQVKVLGLFELNNAFALLVLSGGVTYLFLLIQLDMMWQAVLKSKLLLQT